jgi:hypothetical protein
MKNATAPPRPIRTASHPPGLAVVPTLSPEPAAAARPSPVAVPNENSNANGITVSEEELGSVKAQRLYKMRCECGRSWFELELPTLVECPACKKLCLVSA